MSSVTGILAPNEAIIELLQEPVNDPRVSHLRVKGFRVVRVGNTMLHEGLVQGAITGILVYPGDFAVHKGDQIKIQRHSVRGVSYDVKN